MNDEVTGIIFQRRAEQELAPAQKAEAPAVVAAHYQLVEKYLERVDSAAAIPSGTKDSARQFVLERVGRVQRAVPLIPTPDVPAKSRNGA